MSSLGASLGSAIMGTRTTAKLPPLPADLGLPAKSKTQTFMQKAKGEAAAYDKKSFQNNKAYQEQYGVAETYNKSLADLLNNQPQLNGAERTQIYKAYSDKLIDQKLMPKPLTDFSTTLSQMNPDQYAAQQQAQQEPQAAPAPAPAPVQQAPAPAPVAAPPQTVGPVATPPPTTPVTATPEGNIAGSTKTTVSADTSTAGTGASRGRRGRMATLLTGLGGAVERFGL